MAHLQWCARGSLFDVLTKAAKTPALAPQLDWARRIAMALDAAKVTDSTLFTPCDDGAAYQVSIRVQCPSSMTDIHMRAGNVAAP